MIYLFQVRFPGFDPQEISENHRQELNDSLLYVVQKMVPSVLILGQLRYLECSLCLSYKSYHRDQFQRHPSFLMWYTR